MHYAKTFKKAKKKHVLNYTNVKGNYFKLSALFIEKEKFKKIQLKLYIYIQITE